MILVKDMKLDLHKLLSILHYAQGHDTRYGLGCKVKRLSDSPPEYINEHGEIVNQVDCSGFHRYLIFHSSLNKLNEGIIIPDGSSNQNDWYPRNGYQRHALPEPLLQSYTADMSEQCIYACFCRAGERGEHIGHVWLIYYDMYTAEWWTIESHGGHGPNSRLAMTPILQHIITDAYAISTIEG